MLPSLSLPWNNTTQSSYAYFSDIVYIMPKTEIGILDRNILVKADVIFVKIDFTPFDGPYGGLYSIS